MTIQEVVERAEQRAKTGAPNEQAAEIAGQAASRNAQRDLDVAVWMFGAITAVGESEAANRGR